MKDFFILLLTVIFVFSCNSCKYNENKKNDLEFVFQNTLEKKGFDLGDGVSYYFSAKGNDNNDGLTPETSKQSFSQIKRLRLTAGDNILLKSGDVFTTTLYLNKNILNGFVTVTTYGGDIKAKIQNKYNGIVINECGGYRVNNIIIEITNEAYAYEGALGVGILVKSKIENDNLENIIIENNLFVGKDANRNTRAISFEGINNKENNTPKTIFSKILIVNNKIENFGIAGIGIYVWDSCINNNYCESSIYYNDLEISFNNVSNIGIIGMYFQNCINGKVSHNVVNNAGALTYKNFNWGPVGIMTLVSQNFDICYNNVSNIKDAITSYDGAGIDIDWSSENIRVAYNNCSDNYGGGIVTMACRTAIIENNFLKGNECATIAGRGNINLGDYSADTRNNKNQLSKKVISGVNDAIVKKNIINVTNENTCAVSTSLYDNNFSSERWWQGNSFINNNIILNKTTVATKLHRKCGFDFFDNNLYFTNSEPVFYIYNAIAGDRKNLDLQEYIGMKKWQTYSYNEKKYDLSSKINNFYEVEANILFDVSFANNDLMFTIKDMLENVHYYIVSLTSSENEIVNFANGYHFSSKLQYKHHILYKDTYYATISAIMKNGQIIKSATAKIIL